MYHDLDWVKFQFGYRYTNDKPWLHYGYCTPCMIVARFFTNEITEHIKQCDALQNKCVEGEYVRHIEHYKLREAEIARTSPCSRNSLI